MGSIPGDNDGFILVKPKMRRGKSNARPVKQPNTENSDAGIDCNRAGAQNSQSIATQENSTHNRKIKKNSRQQKLKERTQSSIDDIVKQQVDAVSQKKKMLINSEFFSELGKCIGVVQEFAPLEVVCYGIGSLATQISQWQLALILLLNEHIGAPKILAFDPVTTESDILTYTQVGISMIPVNEQAKRKAAIQTLFYMPHCGQVLYENVVSANWSLEQLSRIMLIGNSLQRYLDSQGEVEFAKRSPHINCILPLVLCTEFPNEKLLKLRYGPYAFTDTCVQYIDPRKAENVSFEPLPETDNTDNRSASSCC